MANDEALTNRVRHALVKIHDVEEKKMFGGLMFMVNGKMCISVGKDRIMCRIDPAIHNDALKRKGCRTVTMKGRKYIGYVHVDKEAVKTKKDFEYWIGHALDYNKKPNASIKKKKQ
jgi:TfoX/Sxy family transcriptional regulator of competence genes